MLFFVIVVLFVVGAYFFNRYQQKRRKEAIAAALPSLGLTLAEDGHQPLDQLYPQFPVFRAGYSRSPSNSLIGWIEVEGTHCRVRTGDYSYRTSGSGNSSGETHRSSYLIVELPWQTPVLALGREGLFARVKQALGFPDLEIGWPDFDQRFTVTCSHPAYVPTFLNPKVSELVLGHALRKGEMAHGAHLSLVVEGGVLMIDEGERLWPTEDIAAHLDFAKRLLAQWPSDLRTPR